MSVALTATYHDPRGRLRERIREALPLLEETFGGLAIRASSAANEESLSLFGSGNALILRAPPDPPGDGPRLGRARRQAIDLALQLDTACIMYCDADRALHWVCEHPGELTQVAEGLERRDFTVLGRTDRAFSTHPRPQRDTEAIVNHAFRIVSGRHWDVMAGARGLSRRAAAEIVRGCLDDGISTDVSWPLHLDSAGGFSLGYTATEGLEFETADRHGVEIAAAGGHAEWLRQLDEDLPGWLHRLEMARDHLSAMAPYASRDNTSPR